jgi:hypothetical protein
MVKKHRALARLEQDLLPSLYAPLKDMSVKEHSESLNTVELTSVESILKRLLCAILIESLQFFNRNRSADAFGEVRDTVRLSGMSPSTKRVRFSSCLYLQH